MPYTLTMGLIWFAAAFVLGIAVGILVRSVTARRQLARARSDARPTSVQAARIAELEDELAAMRAGGPQRPAAGPEPVAVIPDRNDDRGATATGAGVGVGVGDGDGDGDAGSQHPASDGIVGDGPAMIGDGDDLTQVIGLAPHVAELCRGIGIRTFADLAETEVSLLRTLLDDAGPRWRVHDPSTWPDQARLLADGRDAEFDAMAATLRTGSAAEPG